MKKIFIAIFSLLMISAFTKAQIVITADNVLGVNDIVIQAFDNDPDPAILPGDAGENLYWDFSALNIDYTDTFRFVSPTSTPYWGQFPSANLALFTGIDSSYVYFNKNTNNLLMVGVALEIDELGLVSSIVEPNEEFLVFPYEYGFNDFEMFDYLFLADVNITGVDSMKMKRTTMKNSNVDAWGSMTIPMGTYDVLRVHEIRNYTDSVWVKVAFIGWQFFSVEESTEERYLWWSDDPEVGYVLANLNVDPETGDVISSEFMAEPQIVGIEDRTAIAKLDVYPNPAKEKLYINNPINKTTRFSLIDITGKEILSGKIQPNEKKEIQLVNLKPGMYFIRANVGNEVMSRKVLVDNGIY